MTTTVFNSSAAGLAATWRSSLRRGGKLCAGGYRHLQRRGAGRTAAASRHSQKNDHAGARKLLLLGSGTVLVLAAVLYAAVFGLTDTFVSWFNSENSVQMAQYAHTGMRMYFVGYLRASTSWWRAI